MNLADLAYTLQVGREAMEERLGLIVNTLEQLTEKLNAFVSGEINIEGVYQGRVEPGAQNVAIIGRDEDMQEALDKWVARRKFANLLDLWARGLNFDWNKLYEGVKPRRVSLPAYPFAKERYWIDESAARPVPEKRVRTENVRSIEAIIGELDDDRLETGQAVHALKMLM